MDIHSKKFFFFFVVVDFGGFDFTLHSFVAVGIFVLSDSFKSHDLYLIKRYLITGLSRWMSHGYR